jgi:hypothetical protein
MDARNSMARGVSVFDQSIDHAVVGSAHPPTELRRSETVPMGLPTVLLETGPRENEQAAAFPHGRSGLARAWKPLLARAVGAPEAAVPHPPHARSAGARGGGACA